MPGPGAVPGAWLAKPWEWGKGGAGAMFREIREQELGRWWLEPVPWSSLSVDGSGDEAKH